MATDSTPRPLFSVLVMDDGSVQAAPDPATFGPEHIDAMVDAVARIEDAVSRG